LKSWPAQSCAILDNAQTALCDGDSDTRNNHGKGNVTSCAVTAEVGEKEGQTAIPCLNKNLVLCDPKARFLGGLGTTTAALAENHTEPNRNGLQSQAKCLHEQNNDFTSMTQPLASDNKRRKNMSSQIRDHRNCGQKERPCQQKVRGEDDNSRHQTRLYRTHCCWANAAPDTLHIRRAKRG